MDPDQAEGGPKYNRRGEIITSFLYGPYRIASGICHRGELTDHVTRAFATEKGKTVRMPTWPELFPRQRHPRQGGQSASGISTGKPHRSAKPKKRKQPKEKQKEKKLLSGCLTGWPVDYEGGLINKAQKQKAQFPNKGQI